MIKSIKFTKRDKKYNYIGENPVLLTNLYNRKFKFADKKINVLFGPNASGKSTIIKAIAAHCLCGEDTRVQDGLTNFKKYNPTDYGLFEDRTKEKFLNLIDKTAGNIVNVDWDGGFVYNDNFSSRRSVSIGDLCGGVIDDIGEEIHYILGKGKISMGQNSIYLINKLTKICTNKFSIDDIDTSFEKEYKRVNDVWGNTWKLAYDYIKEKHTDDNASLTIMLDEIDKSLDINNIIMLYTEVLPKLVQKYNVQVILVSHSPIILSDKIYNSEDYNIISLDKEYTDSVRNNLLNIF
jgi:predicted ATPase